MTGIKARPYGRWSPSRRRRPKTQRVFVPAKQKTAALLKPKPSKKVKSKKGQPRKQHVSWKSTPVSKRESPERSGNFIVQTTTYYSGGSVVDTRMAWAMGIHSYNRTYSGTVTANYRNFKRKKMRLPLRAHSVNYRRVQDTGWTHVHTDGLHPENNTSRTSNSAAMQDPFHAATYGTESINEALSKARFCIANKIATRHNNLGVMFAERKQTADLISNSVVRLLHAVRDLKRGNLGDMFHSLGITTRQSGLRITTGPSVREYERVLSTPANLRVANHWLEYSFGWVPLVKEIEGAAKLLAQHIETDLYQTTVKCTGKAKSFRYFEAPSGASITPHISYSEQCRAEIGMRYRLEERARLVLSQTGITDPASVLWEILPYSFVVDWFLPVSSYLSKLQAYDAFEFVEGYQSTLHRAAAAKDYYRTGGNSGTQESWQMAGYALFTEETYNRTVLASFPGLDTPSFRNPLENGPIWKFATSFALFRQFFDR